MNWNRTAGAVLTALSRTPSYDPGEDRDLDPTWAVDMRGEKDDAAEGDGDGSNGGAGMYCFHDSAVWTEYVTAYDLWSDTSWVPGDWWCSEGKYGGGDALDETELPPRNLHLTLPVLGGPDS